MKRTFAVLLCVLMLASCLAVCALAAETDREYLDDGSYIIVSDEFIGDGSADDGDSDASGEASPEDSGSKPVSFLKKIIELIKRIIAFLNNQKTVTETKYVSYFSSQGELLWTATVTADFTYNGKSAVCDSVRTGLMIYDSDWTALSKETSKSAGTATACFRLRQSKLGVPLKTIEKTVSISCDKDGNIK